MILQPGRVGRGARRPRGDRPGPAAPVRLDGAAVCWGIGGPVAHSCPSSVRAPATTCPRTGAVRSAGSAPARRGRAPARTRRACGRRRRTRPGSRPGAAARRPARSAPGRPGPARSRGALARRARAAPRRRAPGDTRGSGLGQHRTPVRQGHSVQITTRVPAGAGVSRSVTSSPSTRTRPRSCAARSGTRTARPRSAGRARSSGRARRRSRRHRASGHRQFRAVRCGSSR